jgi:hypothetical protein
LANTDLTVAQFSELMQEWARRNAREAEAAGGGGGPPSPWRGQAACTGEPS